MLSSKLLSRLALALYSVHLVRAQPNNTQVELEAVKAHFAQAGLVPGFLPAAIFKPSALLTISFKGVDKITLGQSLSPEQAVLEPDVSLVPANASVPFTATTRYTLMMVDAGPPGADQSHGQRRHWLVNGVTFPAANANVSMVGATAVTQWLPPNPPVGDGPHRYAILVVAQPADFLAPPDLFLPNTGGGVFSAGEYIRYTRLGDIIAASYFTCQRGSATGTLAMTSAVASETLPGWKGAAQPTRTAEQKANSGLSATRNALGLFLAPIMGLLAL